MSCCVAAKGGLVGRGSLMANEEFPGQEELSGGISRRQMIAGSVVAGGLAWAAPSILSSPSAWAAHTCPCDGVKTTVKLPSDPDGSANCGVQCLSHREEFNFPCLDDLVSCLIDQGFVTISNEDFEHGQARKARVILTGGISLLAVGAKSDNECYFADCDDGFCPNTCETQAGTACEGGSAVPPNRITVCPGGSTPGSTCVATATTAPCVGPGAANRTEFIVDMQGDPINPIEVALCIPPALTGICE